MKRTILFLFLNRKKQTQLPRKEMNKSEKRGEILSSKFKNKGREEAGKKRREEERKEREKGLYQYSISSMGSESVSVSGMSSNDFRTLADSS